MDAMKIKRELDALDLLEKRVRALKNPSKVLLAHIEKRRHEILNPEVTVPST